MNRFATMLSSTTAALLMMSSPLFAQAEVGPSANGHGNLTIVGELQTLSFHARQFTDGTVTGSMVAKSRGQNVRLFADLDCLNVVGNPAVMSGVVTQSNNPAFPAGRGAIFRVVDNGEGANDLVDMMTDVILFTVPSVVRCHNTFLAPLMPVEEGNIQVRETLFSLLP